MPLTFDSMLHELDSLLDEYTADNSSNRAHGIVQHVVMMRRFMKEGVFDTFKGNSKNFGQGFWNQRKSKFDSSCSGCGTYIASGTVAWVTVGIRCEKCGRPEEAQCASPTAN